LIVLIFFMRLARHTIARRLAPVGLVFAILVQTAIPALSAGTGQINGRVTDSTTKAPLAGVKITAVSTSGEYRAVTDSKGTFSMVGVTPDTYTVAFELTGYDAFSIAGVTVVPDNSSAVDATLGRKIREIARTTTRATLSSAYQPRSTQTSYVVGTTAIDALQGKAFNADEKTLLSRLPSVTPDDTGTIFIRGGSPLETSREVEGIDYDTPNTNLQNKFQNTGTFNLLNGIGTVQVVPGGGDASHGNSGTGLISYTVKRGTYPGFANIDLEAVSYPFDHQLSFEYGNATKDGRLSGYFSFTGIRQGYQWGQIGTAGESLGIFADNATLTSLQGRNSVGVLSSAADQESNDALLNLYYKFGKNLNQQVQFFYQNQIVRQGLNYSGIGNTCYASCNPQTTAGTTYADCVIPTSTQTPASGTVSSNCAPFVPLFPGQGNPQQNVGAQDAIYNPFLAYKIEYRDNIDTNTFGSIRYYRTFNEQTENLASLGVYIPENGGTRTGGALEIDRQIGTKNFVQIGGKYEFVTPYGQTEDVVRYLSGLFGDGNIWPLYPAPGGSSSLCSGVYGNCIPAAPIYSDFTPASQCGPTGTQKYGGLTNLINQPGAPPGFGQSAAVNVQCGFLAPYFPHGIPRFPAEVELPETSQQVYGWFVQDRLQIGKYANAQVGLRLDGYNFLYPTDPANPPTVTATEHQRLFEPHVGISRAITPVDSLRVTYGRTLSIPEPGIAGDFISRAAFNAYNGIPSFNNLTGFACNGPGGGPFLTACAPGVPAGKAATYCGINFNQTCTSYADQLFWLVRDARVQSQLNALEGATFTNYDLTYSHLFPGNLAFSITPFYRRGYNVLQSSNVYYLTPQGYYALNPSTLSNNGLEKTTGVEALLTREVTTGLYARFAATYINQLVNNPPTDYLGTPSLLLGNIYRSNLFSPFQSSLALVYNTRSGFRVNPVFTYTRGYPYGVGTIAQVFLPDGQPANVPNTNLSQGTSGNFPYCYVDPQLYGTVKNPNIANCAGVAAAASPGGVLSKAWINTDISLSYHAPASKATYGVAITNLFNQLYGVPFPNPGYQPVNVQPSGKTITPVAPGYSTGTLTYPYYSYGNQQYLYFPNRPPFQARFFVQVGI
jgi:hypothetical protein